jgi:hypothetical protein
MKKTRTYNVIIGKLVLLGVIFAIFTAGGCRASPMSLAGMVAGDVVNDVDVSNRQDKLVGQPETAADAMFGARLETCDDVQIKGVTMIAYPVKFDVLGTSRYIVETSNGKIAVLSKTKQNLDGAEDVIKSVALKQMVIGKTPTQCQIDGDLGSPLRTLRSRGKNQLLRIYDVRNITNLRGARYCVLRFGAGDLCEAVTLVGVSASTKNEPAKR